MQYQRILVGKKVLSGFLVLTLLLLTIPLPRMASAETPKPKAVSPKDLPKEPPVRIVAPESGRTISAGDKVDIQVLLRRDIDLKASSVQILCDGRGIGLISTKPYVYSWDTANIKEGKYIIEANAFLATGNKVAAPPVEINVRSSAVMLAEGTPILVVTEEKMESGEIQTGATIRFKVDRDVLGPDGKILIPAGAVALGEVVKSEGSGFFGKAGTLDFAVRSVTAADGTTVPLRAARNAEGSDNTAGVIVGALLLSVFFVFLSGDDVEIPAGTLFTAYAASSTLIARPLPPRLDAATLNIDRTVTITIPAAGAKVQKTDRMTFACTLAPADDQAYLRLYLDDKLAVSQRGAPEKIEWRGTEDMKPGEHTLQVETTFSIGRIVKSPVVRFMVSDD